MDKHEYKEISSMAANGDTKAFARLYETLYKEMYYTAYYSLRDDSDAISAVTGTIKDGFAAVGRLHSEQSFRVFMMKSLCARIKTRFKDYGADESDNAAESVAEIADGIDIKREFDGLPDTERLVAALYASGNFTRDEIAAFTGLSTNAVKSKLSRAMDIFALD